MNASPNRVVAIATPLVFAPLAGAVTALAAKYAPGLDIEQGQLEAVFIAGATIAVAKAALWLKGWQDYEKRQEVMATAGLADVASRDYLDDDVLDSGIEDEFDTPDFDDPHLDDSDEDIEDVLVAREG